VVQLVADCQIGSKLAFVLAEPARQAHCRVQSVALYMLMEHREILAFPRAKQELRGKPQFRRIHPLTAQFTSSLVQLNKARRSIPHCALKALYRASSTCPGLQICQRMNLAAQALIAVCGALLNACLVG